MLPSVVSEVDDTGQQWNNILLVWTIFYCPSMPWKEGLDERRVEETLTLLTSLNYLHIPICHPDHSQGTWRTGPGKDERRRGSTRRTWHSARESSMTRREERRKWPAGISQWERQKRSQLFILAGAKRAPEQVVQPGASGATEEEKRGEEEDDDKRHWSSLNVWTLLLHFRTPPPHLALIASPSIIMHKYSRDSRISLSEPQSLFMRHFPKGKGR